VPEFRILSTGNEEFDVKLGGGLPYPTLVIIEGEHGTGKTALSQLLLLGALRAGLRALVLTSESRPADYVIKASASGFPLEDYYIKGQLRVYSLQYPGDLTVEVADEIALRLASLLPGLAGEYGFLVVDSLSYIASRASEPLLNQLVVALRAAASKGLGVVATIHPSAAPKGFINDLLASADGYLRVSQAVVGGRRLKVLSIVKLRGAPPGIETTITFDVDPAFGIKLVPIMVSQA